MKNTRNFFAHARLAQRTFGRYGLSGSSWPGKHAEKMRSMVRVSTRGVLPRRTKVRKDRIDRRTLFRNLSIEMRRMTRVFTRMRVYKTNDGRQVLTAFGDGLISIWRSLESIDGPDDTRLWSATSYCLPLELRRKWLGFSEMQLDADLKRCGPKVEQARSSH